MTRNRTSKTQELSYLGSQWLGITTRKVVRHETVTHLNEMMALNKKKCSPQKGSRFCFRDFIRKSPNCRNTQFFQLLLNRRKQTVKTSHYLPNRVAAASVCRKKPQQPHIVFWCTGQKLLFSIKLKLLTSDINHINFCFTEFSVTSPICQQ